MASWNRCSRCRGDVPNEETVWLDARGEVVVWEGMPEGPAPYHRSCAEERRAERGLTEGVG